MNLTRKILVVTQNRADVTYSIALIGLFSILEVNVGMICAALPTLGPLFFKDSGSSGGGWGSSSEKINSFARRKAAGLGIWSGKAVRVASGEAGLSTLDEEDDAVALRDVRGNRELGLGRQNMDAGTESRINVRTDIYIA